MEITFPPEVEASAFPLQLKQELVGMATNLAGVGVGVAGFDQEPYYYNPDTGSHLPFNIRIAGYNFEKLMEFSQNLKKSLLKHKRIKEAEVQTDMRFWWGARDKYYGFKLNRAKLKKYGLQSDYLLFLIGTIVMESTRAQRLKFDERELCELFDMREAIEVFLVEGVIEKVTDQDLEELDRLREYHREVDYGNMMEKTILDNAFHVIMANIADNQLFLFFGPGAGQGK